MSTVPETTGRVHRRSDKTPGAWADFIAAMHSGKPFECDEEMWYYWLEVLPPAFMNRTVKLDGRSRRVTFGFAEGHEPITAFWREIAADGMSFRYFGQRTNIMNRPS